METHLQKELFEILKEITKNSADVELIKKARKKIDEFSENRYSTEKILDVMEKADVYLGMTKDRIWNYLKEMDIINDVAPNNKNVVYKNLKKNNKVKYIKKLLYNELEDLKKVIEEKKDSIKALLLEKIEYRILEMILEMEEKDAEKLKIIKILNNRIEYKKNEPFWQVN